MRGQNDHAAIRIEPGIENQRAQRSVGIAARRRHALHDGFQRFVNADALFRAHQKRVARIEADHVFNLLANAFGLGRGQIDLVNYRDNFQIMVQREIGIGEGLGFHALRRVDHEQRALAGLQAARNFVGKVHVAGGIDQIELIPVAVVGLVIEPHGVRFDGDSALALEIHRVEHLRHHFALGKRACRLQKAVRQGAFSVVDMRNDGEIPYEFRGPCGKMGLNPDYPICHFSSSLLSRIRTGLRS